jgi:hypothetical protein
MPRSVWTRFARASFGLLAIWCLGCTSFDEVLGALLRGRSSADCSMSIGESTASDVASAPAARDDLSSRGCGCDHCVAVRADATVVSIPPQATPEGAQDHAGSALSVDREPLVPPPIARVG